MTDWSSNTIGGIASEAATGPFGSAVSSRHFVMDGIPMLRGSNLSDKVGTRLDTADLVFLPESIVEQFPRAIARAGDLVFTCWGTIGQIGLLNGNEAHDRFLVSNKQMRMRPDPQVVNPTFLYYFLSQPSMVDLVRGQAIGSSVPGFNLGQLRSLPISYPPLPEQQAIAEVLGALDDKIAANTALVAKADELRHSTFRSLAVRKEVPLSQTAAFINGKAFTKGASGTGRVVVRIAELNGGISGSTVFSDALVDDKHVARPGDILFAWSGSLTLHRWFRAEAIVNQHIFKVIPAEGYPAWLAYELLRQKLTDFKAIAADKATTMGHIQRHHLDEIVRVPSATDADRLNPVMSALWGVALNAERESLTLAATRDALLPQLMSGKLRVRDAEKVAEEAGL